jgi:hypothetical protein
VVWKEGYLTCYPESQRKPSNVLVHYTETPFECVGDVELPFTCSSASIDF